MNLLRFPDGRYIHRTYAWVVPGKENRLDSVEVLIDPPPPHKPSLPVADLKAWLLSEPEKHRFLEYRNDKGEKTYRKVTAEATFTGYVQAVLQRAGFQKSDQRSLHLLIPALSSDEIHFRYLRTIMDAVTASLPDVPVDILSEPEMILEFFRIIKNMVRIQAGSNRFFLVVDSGASTTNFTVIISTRSGEVTEAAKKRRKQNLRPICFDAALLAGRAVDTEILYRLAPDFKEAPEGVRDEALMRVEQAKLNATKTQKAVSFSLPGGSLVALSPEILRNITRWLWTSLASNYEQVARLLLDQLLSGAGIKQYGAMLAERYIQQPADVARLFDAVFLAGGTSQLPGFEEEMRATMKLQPATPVHSVLGAYPVAAAIGGMAHVLARQRNTADAQDEDSLPAEAGGEIDFTPSLPYNIVLDCQDRKGTPSTPNRITVIARGQPVAQIGGSIEFELPRSWSPRVTARARLVPSLSDDFRSDRTLRVGAGFKQIEVSKPNGIARGNFDAATRRLTLRSDDAPGLLKLHYKAGPLRIPAADEQNHKSQPEGSAKAQQHLDVVIDIGMSKTIIALSPRTAQLSDFTFDKLDLDTPTEPGYASPTPMTDPALQSLKALASGNASGNTPNIPIPSASAPKLPQSAEPTDVIKIAHAFTQTADAHSSADTIQSPVRATSYADAPLPEPSYAATVVNPGPAVEYASSHARVGDFPDTNHLPDVCPDRLTSPLELSEPIARIRSVVEAAVSGGIGIDERQLALAYLALCTRRFVLLAGPPGSGKSTIVRLLAKLLGCSRGDRFSDLSVQAHWVNDDPLFGSEGELVSMLDGARHFHMVLLDEVNLTRPEYYLSRLFGALDHHGRIGERKLPPLGLVGTLNIDDFSRPPSPKVLDRAMLLVVSPRVLQGQLVRCAWQEVLEATTGNGVLGDLAPPARRTAVEPGQPSTEAKERIESWVGAAYDVFRSKPETRPDLVPSHRAIQDLMRFAALHNTLGLKDVIPEVDALDQVILGRFVAPISGPEAEVRALIEAWRPLCGDLPETGRKLERLMQQVATHGFASFWQ